MMTVRDRAGMRLGVLHEDEAHITLRDAQHGYVMLDGEYKLTVRPSPMDNQWTFMPEGPQLLGDIVYAIGFRPDPVFLESRRMKLQPVARALGRPRGRAMQL